MTTLNFGGTIPRAAGAPPACHCQVSERKYDPPVAHGRGGNKDDPVELPPNRLPCVQLRVPQRTRGPRSTKHGRPQIEIRAPPDARDLRLSYIVCIRRRHAAVRSPGCACDPSLRGPRTQSIMQLSPIPAVSQSPPPRSHATVITQTQTAALILVGAFRVSSTRVEAAPSLLPTNPSRCTSSNASIPNRTRRALQ